MASADGSENQIIGRGGLSVTTISDEVARLGQALLDLSHSQGSSLALTHCPTESGQTQLLRQLTQAGHDRGAVVANVSLEEKPVDAIDSLVCAVLDALTAPAQPRAQGIFHVLSAFYDKHGRRSLERFDEGCEAAGVDGELVALSRAYLQADDDAHREVAALAKWASGVPLSARDKVDGVRGTLNVHNGQRVLGELSRLLVALGHQGLLLLLSSGQSIAARSERQREKGYTLLRELVDNFDSGRAAVATKIIITGGDALFVGQHSLQELPPLFARLQLPSAAEPPPPHRTWTSLVREPYQYVHRRVRSPEDTRPEALRSLIRISQGLPPIDSVAQMSVGHERVDKTVDRLFEHAEMSGSVFQVLSGEYGSGKTHILLHLADRALSAGHPVFWLNLERMNLDLGNPARHLSRVLAHSVLPGRHRSSALERLSVWTRRGRKLNRLLSTLEEIAGNQSQESKAAKKALSLAADADDPGHALEVFLSAEDLSDKSSGKSYRIDAYRRLLLWMELLSVIEGVEGPVVLIDEAENLYTSGVTEAQRRSALRTLSFYCGGALPGACVIMAMTPPALSAMRRESNSLLKVAAEVDSTLEVEDVDLFRRRLHLLKPDEVPVFSQPMRRELARKIRALHRNVRGAVELEDWDQIVKEQVRQAGPPRLLMRCLVDELESAWWAGA